MAAERGEASRARAEKLQIELDVSSCRQHRISTPLRSQDREAVAPRRPCWTVAAKTNYDFAIVTAGGAQVLRNMDLARCLARLLLTFLPVLSACYIDLQPPVAFAWQEATEIGAESVQSVDLPYSLLTANAPCFLTTHHRCRRRFHSPPHSTASRSLRLGSPASHAIAPHRSLVVFLDTHPWFTDDKTYNKLRWSFKKVCGADLSAEKVRNGQICAELRASEDRWNRARQVMQCSGCGATLAGWRAGEGRAGGEGRERHGSHIVVDTRERATSRCSRRVRPMEGATRPAHAWNSNVHTPYTRRQTAACSLPFCFRLVSFIFLVHSKFFEL